MAYMGMGAVDLASTWTDADIDRLRECRAFYAQSEGRDVWKDERKEANRYVKAATICIDWLTGKAPRLHVPAELEHYVSAVLCWRHRPQ